MPRTYAPRILRSSATVILAVLPACAGPDAGSSRIASQDPAPRPTAARATDHDSAAISDPSSDTVQQSSPAARSADSYNHSSQTARDEPSPSIAPHSSSASDASSKADPSDSHAEAPQSLPNKMRTPSIPWVASHVPFDPIKEITLSGKWTGNRRLELHTDNVQRLTLNLHNLPSDAPTTGPWNLQIDRQGIEISGRRGKVIDLIRSPNGVWSVDREKSPIRR